MPAARYPAERPAGLLVLALAACNVSDPVGTDGDSVPAQVPTWYQDVRPIFAEKCTGCHQQGYNPIVLADYAQVVAFAEAALGKMQGSDHAPYVMPPWPIPDSETCTPPAPWADDPRITDDELATMRAWVKGGTPEGDEASATPVEPPGVPLLTGDNVEYLPGSDATIPGDPDSLDYNLCFSFPLGKGEEGWIDALQIIPDPGNMIHHIIVASDPTGVTAPADGSNGVNNCPTQEIPETKLLFTWITNTGPFYYPPNSGMTVEPGARILLTFHYHQKDEEQYDNTGIAVRWLDEKPRYYAWMDRFGGAHATEVNWAPVAYRGGWEDSHFGIPKNSANHEEIWYETWGQQDRDDGFSENEYPIWGVFPHMHYAGLDIRMDLEHDDGSRECLSHIERFDSSWQQTYLYDVPVDKMPTIRPEDRMRITCHYDNTLGNDRLREALVADDFTEPFDVTVGDTAFDEMCVMHFGMLVENEFSDQ